MLSNSRVSGFGHGQHQRSLVRDRIPLNRNLHGRRSHARMEIVNRMLIRTDPFTKITCICEGSGESDDTNRVLGLDAHKTHTRDDDLERRADIRTNQMSFIDNKQPDGLDILSLFPTTRDHIPFLGSRKDDITTLKKLEIGRGFASKRNNILAAQDISKLGLPLIHA